VIVAIAGSLDSMISFSIAEAVDKGVDPSSVVPLQALWDNDFFPFALGVAVFLWALGISVVKHGALPKWIGYVAILAGIAAVTPVGFFSSMVAGILVLVSSVVLAMRAGSAATA